MASRARTLHGPPSGRERLQQRWRGSRTHRWMDAGRGPGSTSITNEASLLDSGHNVGGGGGGVMVNATVGV